MNITELIAQHITDVHNGSNWTDVNVKDTLQDVSFTEANTVTKASPNSIAMLLYHISFYNEVMLQRLLNLPAPVSQTNGFDAPHLNNEEDWKLLQEKNIQSAQKLADAVKSFPEEKLYQEYQPGKSSYYKNLHGIAEHAHYHLGQMMILKKLIKQENNNGNS